MQTFNYVITDDIGIHARPAGALAKTAKTFSSKITISANGKSAEATKLMSVMGLGAKKGTQITVTVEGDDEIQAANEIEEFLKGNL
jgi:phosphocarrier protein